MAKRIISVDFDGVIHSYDSPWKGPGVVNDPPVPGAIDMLLHYLDTGFAVAIYGARSKSFRGRRAMKCWMAYWIAYHWRTGGSAKVYDVEVECLGDAKDLIHKFMWPWFKPPAFITIDDRALTFTGDWLDYTPEKLNAFKPWNKR